MVDERDVFETNVNTDGRKQYDWESKYPECAQKEMKKEAIYIAIILIIAFSLLIFIVGGLIDKVGNLIGLEAKKTASLEGVIIYFFSGVVSRGYWSQDRKYWRFFSPWISACVAFVVGCMVLSGYINATQTQSFAAEICVGFITGYFADEAVGKMSEVATALFGSNSKTDPNKVDSNSNVGSNK